MILKTFVKQPHEYKDYDIDYSPWLTPIEDTLNLIEFSIHNLDDPDDNELKIESHFISEKRLKIWVSGGTDGCSYKVDILATTVSGRRDESELIFAVVEI